jgi:hypothetical protein
MGMPAVKIRSSSSSSSELTEILTTLQLRLSIMEKGNEGDEIIFLSLRQIECNIPAEVVKVGQIGADLLVEIIVRSLLLITDGDAKV